MHFHPLRLICHERFRVSYEKLEKPTVSCKEVYVHTLCGNNSLPYLPTYLRCISNFLDFIIDLLGGQRNILFSVMCVGVLGIFVYAHDNTYAGSHSGFEP